MAARFDITMSSTTSCSTWRYACAVKQSLERYPRDPAEKRHAFCTPLFEHSPT